MAQSSRTADNSRMLRASPLAALLVFLSACGDPLATPAPVPFDNPAPDGSAQPSLAVGRDGRLWMSWLATDGDSSHVLMVASRQGGAWSAPRRVAAGADLFANWADVPMLAESRTGMLAAAWLSRSAKPSAYNLRIATSRDSGATWSAPRMPHTDGTDTEHGFISWVAAGDSLELAWLDGRRYALADSAQHVMQLAWTTLGSDGTTPRELMLDEMICDCCQTSATTVGATSLIAYRNRTDKEIRDIQVIRLRNGVVMAPVRVAADEWHIAGCPVNGPSIAARDGKVAVAWFAAPNDSARVRLAWSRDTGATFGPPVAINEGRAEGRVQVEVTPRGDALVHWVETTPTGSVLLMRRVSAAGERGAPVEVARSTGGKRAAGFAKLVALADGAVLAWTDPATKRVRTASIAYGAK